MRNMRLPLAANEQPAKPGLSLPNNTGANGTQVASATSATTTATTKSPLTWVIVAVVAVVAIGAGWFFFFNNDITGTWVAEESGTTVEVVFDKATQEP